ncbi:MAG: oxidoreductase [Spirochaetales bacterium]|nr:oxidoreductase [Spirochaetales bacterium]
MKVPASTKSVMVCQNLPRGKRGRWLSWERDFDFLPGQIVGVTDDPNRPPRWYSLASGNKDSWASILFTPVDSGELSPILSRLVPGDRIWITPPQGSFLDKKKQAVWVATGTGVAPFLAMARSGFAGTRVLVQGARYLEDLYFREEWQKRLGKNYIACCTREQGVFDGRVTRYLESQKWPMDTHFFLCGSSEMVVDARDLLISQGIPFSQIVAEVYF